MSLPNYSAESASPYLSIPLLPVFCGIGRDKSGSYRLILHRYTRPDDLGYKFYPVSPFAFCLNNPMIHTDPTGKIVDTIWDVANVAADLGMAAYHYATGDTQSAKSDLKDAAWDTAAALIPGVPAGGSKVIKAFTKSEAKNVGKVNAKALKTVSKSSKNVKSTSTVTFIQGKGDKAKKITLTIPKGFKKIGTNKEHGVPIIKKGISIFLRIRMAIMAESGRWQKILIRLITEKSDWELMMKI